MTSASMPRDITLPVPKLGYVRSETITTLSEDYDLALEWLSSFFKISDRSRFQTYKNSLRVLKEYERASDIAAVLADIEARSAFFEAHRIVHVYSALHSVIDSVAIPSRTLAKLKSGNSLNYFDARSVDSSDPSRDTFFELSVAAAIIKAGMKVGFTENDEDLFTEFESHKVYIECKRIQSKRQYYRRLHEANEQLSRRYTKGKVGEFGVVFLSADAIINPDFEIQTVTSDTDYFHVETLLQPYSNAIKYINRYGMPVKKTVAFFTEVTYPFIVADNSHAGMRDHLEFASYFHHSGFVSDLGFQPQRRMNYFEVFENFREALWKPGAVR